MLPTVLALRAARQGLVARLAAPRRLARAASTDALDVGMTLAVALRAEQNAVTQLQPQLGLQRPLQDVVRGVAHRPVYRELEAPRWPRWYEDGRLPFAYTDPYGRAAEAAADTCSGA
jgi:hypothetical protein